MGNPISRPILLTLTILSFAFLIIACSGNKETGGYISGRVVSEDELEVGTEPGQLAPNFVITTTDGKKYSTSRLRQEGTPFLLYFWKPDCEECQDEFAAVKDVYPSYSGKFRFLAISLDLGGNEEEINVYQEKYGAGIIDFAKGDSEIISSYEAIRTSLKYAISRDGIIVYKGSGVLSEGQWRILMDGIVKG